MRTFVMLGRGLLLLGACFVSAACGEADDDDPAVPIEDIPDDKRIVDLSAAEREGVCDWAASVAHDELPPAGTVINCDGFEIRMNAPTCSAPSGDQSGCEATIAEYKVCLPALMSRIGADPCQLLDITSDAEAREFVETTPGCAGLGPCGYAL